MLFIFVGVVVFCVLWLFEKYGQKAWFYSWIALSIFNIFITYIGPVLILPFFNRLIQLPDGKLRSSIENYAKEQNFKLVIFSL